MLLSIIVAVFNEEKHICRCVESVLSQTFCDYELILVDDGSTDHTPEICDEYASGESNITVIHKENGGLISARMKGVEIAKGDYITFIDGDDWIDSGLYEKLMIPVLDNPEIEISISAYISEDGQGNQKEEFQKTSPMIMTSCSAIQEMFTRRYFDWSGCGKVYRRSIALRFYDNWWSYNSYGEDTEWNWKMMSNAKAIYYSAESGYHYCYNPDSMMHRALSMNHLIYIDRLERIITEIDIQSDLYQIVNELLALYCSDSLITLYQREDDCDKEIIKCRESLINLMKREVDSFSGKTQRRINYAMMGKNDFRSMMIKSQKELYEAYQELSRAAEEVYIYGAGVIGKWVAECLLKKKTEFNGFVVSDSNPKENICMSKPVYPLNDMLNDIKSKAFMVAVNEKHENEIKRQLKNYGFELYKCVGMYSLSY